MTVELSYLTSPVDRSRVDDVLVVRLAGQVDMRTAPEVQQALDETLERVSGGRVVIDLTDVAFFGSPGLAVLAEAAAQADRHHCALRVVVGINPIVRRSIEVTGLDRVLTLCVNVVEAVTV
jgi:anti-sigma B factor antagonist